MNAIPNKDGSVAHGGPEFLCGAKHPKPRPDLKYGAYVCTLAEGHDGKHEARVFNPDFALATWPDLDLEAALKALEAIDALHIEWGTTQMRDINNVQLWERFGAILREVGL